MANEKEEKMVEFHGVMMTKSWADFYERRLKICKEHPEKNAPHKCPVCGQFTFEAYGSYDMCPVCTWEDDNVDMEQPDRFSDTNHISLNAARRNYELRGDIMDFGLGHGVYPQDSDEAGYTDEELEAMAKEGTKP